MKFLKMLVFALASGAIAFNSTPSFSQSTSELKDLNFGCANFQGNWTTFSINKGKEAEPLIYWKQTYFGSDAEKLYKDSINVFKAQSSESKLVAKKGEKTIVCLPKDDGDCSIYGTDKLFDIKTPTTTDKDDDIIRKLSEIIDPNFAKIKQQDLKGINVAYVPTRYRPNRRMPWPLSLLK
jgi:hypothetical protein